MRLKILSLLVLFVILSSNFVSIVDAQQSPPSEVLALINGRGFINIVMPVRGDEFWTDTIVSPAQSHQEYLQAIRNRNLPATFLFRFDALNNQEIVNSLKGTNFEVGIFLEITPKLTEAAGVQYNEQATWHNAGSVLVTGYSPDDRKKLIDTYFNRFNAVFGYTPKSVGAWWIDGGSLTYLQEKYGIVTAMSVADQFSTDQYEVWGQYWSSPFYPSKLNASQPAQSESNRTGTVNIQWAARDPYNGFGKAVEESTYSVQGNDYLLHPGLTTDYFRKMLDIYTKDNVSPYGQVTVGIENDFTQTQFREEFNKQLDLIKSRQNETNVVTMQSFGNWFKATFPRLTPTKVISAYDPLDSGNQVVWFQNNQYRTGIFQREEGVVIRDLREYSDQMKESCLEKACNELDLARTISKPLDDVSFNQKVFLDEGPSTEFKVENISDTQTKITYRNWLGKIKEVILMERDIVFDNKPHAIAGLIIESTINPARDVKIKGTAENPNPILNLQYSLISSLTFIAVLIAWFILPGRFLTRRVTKTLNFWEELVISSILGICVFIIVSIIGGVVKLPLLTYGILIILAGLGLRGKPGKIDFSVQQVPLVVLLVLGIIVSVLPVFKSGLLYPYGLGFWGPNGHDALWHLSLITSLQNSVPPENFAYAGNTLTNYHYFFDLILATLAKIPNLDPAGLYFRLWPIFISLLLGGGVWLLGRRLGLSVIAIATLLFLTFFAGSWGFIVTILQKLPLGGESLFWANQSISLHLNPPFALSLVMLIGILSLFQEKLSKGGIILIAVITALLWGTKAYAGVLVLIALGILALRLGLLKKQKEYLALFILSALLSLAVFLPLTSATSSLFVFSPFWLLNSLVSSEDRLNISYLSRMWNVYVLEEQSFKLFLLQMVVLVIFLIGNLGGRIIGLPKLIHGITRQKPVELSLSIIAMSGLLFSLLFVQKGNDWNIVQFFYYSLFAASIFSAITIHNFVQSRGGKKVLLLGVSVVIILLSSVTTYTTIREYFPGTAHASVTTEELKALTFLKDLPYGTVLIPPYIIDPLKEYQSPVPLYLYETTSSVSSLSNKPAYLADEMNLQIMGVDYRYRKIALTEFFRDPGSSWGTQFLKDNNIRYIYVYKSNDFKEKDLAAEKVFENNEIKIYRVY